MTRPARRAPRIRALAVAGVLAVVPPALAGCGGQAQQVRDAGVYAERVNQVQARFERDLGTLNAAADRAEDRRDVQTAVRRLSRRIDGVQAELRAITPPAVAADPHARLIAAFGRWKAPLEAFRRALRDRDPRATLRAKSDFSTETTAVEQQVNTAARQINDRLRSLAD
ncbi:hypothetical protein [Patulibacter sp. SYSU D01012]|uniref:hypothetical protein n=1 Tax=Patulibacter sp. SYSU D01012 TaxID=2817381 RepID=UPI001B30C722|nr:hypothetical protein [Patulibacter sp. SYSU D01012]